MKTHLLIFRLHPAVCFNTAPLSDPISAAWLFRGEGMILRIEEKRREEKRREEKRREEKRREEKRRKQPVD